MLTKHQENLIKDYTRNPPSNRVQVLSFILTLQEGILKNKNRIFNSHSQLSFKDLEDIENLKCLLSNLGLEDLVKEATSYIKTFYETHNQLKSFKQQFKYSI